MSLKSAENSKNAKVVSLLPTKILLPPPYFWHPATSGNVHRRICHSRAAPTLINQHADAIRARLKCKRLQRPPGDPHSLTALSALSPCTFQPPYPQPWNQVREAQHDLISTSDSAKPCPIPSCHPCHVRPHALPFPPQPCGEAQSKDTDTHPRMRRDSLSMPQLFVDQPSSKTSQNEKSQHLAGQMLTTVSSLFCWGTCNTLPNYTLPFTGCHSSWNQLSSHIP